MQQAARTFTEPELREIRARADLAHIVSERVILTPDGKGGWFGLCPFHSQRMPSFRIRGEKFHCSECGEEGDVFAYVGKLNETGIQMAAKLVQAATDQR